MVVTRAVGTLQEENHVCKVFTLLALLAVPLEQEGHPKGPFLMGWEWGAEAGSPRFLGLIQPQTETWDASGQSWCRWPCPTHRPVLPKLPTFLVRDQDPQANPLHLRSGRPTGLCASHWVLRGGVHGVKDLQAPLWAPPLQLL